MRTALFAICALSALLAACDGEGGVRITSTSDDGAGKGVLKVVQTLQCPQTMGVLTRKGTAQAEGTVCTYVGPRGAEVSLHLIALDETPVDGVLKMFEDQLSRDMPDQTRAIAEGAAADAEAQRADAEADKADAEAQRADAAADRAQVRMPGLSVDAQGDKADVKIGPITIRADDSDANVDITGDQGETVNIEAHEGGAEIRTRDGGPATRATWTLTDARRTQSGWRSVGYRARGPEGGPIVLATVRSKDRDDDRVFDAAEDLVRLNVGE